MMMQFPNVTVIGDTTSATFAFTGGFSLPESGSYMVFPTMAMMNLDYQFIDRTGIPPDIYVEATAEDFQAGIDPVYDYAMGLLTN